MKIKRLEGLFFHMFRNIYLNMFRNMCYYIIKERQ